MCKINWQYTSTVQACVLCTLTTLLSPLGQHDWHAFSRSHGPLAPSTSHSSWALSILSPGHMVLWLPPHLIQAQPCPCFLQATRSSGSLHISFKLSPVHAFSRPHGPVAPSTSHSSSALSMLSPGHTVLWLPPHLIQAQPCPCFLQVTRSCGSLHISFKLSPVHAFSRPHGPLAPSTSHSNSALYILSPGHTVLWLPPHLIPTQLCTFFLQATRSSGSLHISFQLSSVHSFSRPHGPLAPSTSHSNSALYILSPGHTVLWLPPHLIQAQPCPCFLQATRFSGSLHISFQLSSVHSFSRPHGPLAPSTSYSSSALSIPSHRPTTVLLAFLLIFSPQRHLARWCWWGFSSHSDHISNPSELPLLRDPSSVSYFPMCSAPLLCMSAFGDTTQIGSIPWYKFHTNCKYQLPFWRQQFRSQWQSVMCYLE